jgi:hypothetical protein
MCCVRGRSSTRDRANHSDRHTAPSGFWRSALRTTWRSIRDGPAARDPGAHNRLTVGRHLISNIHDDEIRARRSCIRPSLHGGEVAQR